MEITEILSNPITYFIVGGVFVWLIPLWHSGRSGSLLANIEVLALLALSVALPISAVAFAATLGFLGALGVIPALGGGAVLWFAALLIGLAADLGEKFRR
jgi:hypothetical protein